MKLVYTELEQQLVFQENRVNVLVVENKELFRRMIQELAKQIDSGEGRFVLSDNDKTLKIDNDVSLVVNPFALEINSRKALTGLYNELGKLGMNEENYLNTCRVKGQIAEYTYGLLNQVDYALKFQDDFNLQSLFKALEVEVKILAFVNLKTYLTNDELQKFYKEAFYRKMHLLLLENSVEQELAEEAVCIVDDDLCVVK